MTLTIPSPQISNARTIPVAPALVTTPDEGETNATNIPSVIIPIVPVTNLEPAVNILGEEQDAEGSYVHNLPEIFTSFSE
jgi:hypothetical protein